MNPEFWRGRSVLVTGHTGFKGTWLSLWLARLGAAVHGYSTEAPTEPNLFALASAADDLASHTIGDLRDLEGLQRAMLRAEPAVVFHLGAQSLVRFSYQNPVETFAVNVLGTVHLMEAARRCRTVRALVNVTTDKCYENREWVWGYRETDRLGGSDPYSSSKACAELATAAYRASYLDRCGIAVATVRAGNVVGGGDFGSERLLPDFFRALRAGEELIVRDPEATRPWQHVLEPLAGYLQLAERLTQGDSQAVGAWNFGPTSSDARTVRWVLDYLCARLPRARWRHVASEGMHEAHALSLDSTKARVRLGWSSRWPLEVALDRSIDGYRSWMHAGAMREICLEQIAEYGSICVR